MSTTEAKQRAAAAKVLRIHGELLTWTPYAVTKDRLDLSMTETPGTAIEARTALLPGYMAPDGNYREGVAVVVVDGRPFMAAGVSLDEHWRVTIGSADWRVLAPFQALRSHPAMPGLYFHGQIALGALDLAEVGT